MTDLLPTDITPGQAGHATLHSATNGRVNALMRDSVFIPATSFALLSGTPNLTATNPAVWPAWLLDFASTEIVSASFRVPFGWSTAETYLVWGAHGTGGGNALVQVRAYLNKQSGDLLNTGEITLEQKALAVPPQFTMTRTKFGSTVTLTSNPEATVMPLGNISVRRLGADALDTSPNDISILGIELVRAS